VNLGVGGLPFFGMITGQLLAGVLIFIRQPGYQKKLDANNNVPIPEWRLPEVIVGGICFSVGIFWFGWTGYKQDIHWIVPTLSGILIGFGLLSIFLQALNYLVDAYLMVSCPLLVTILQTQALTRCASLLLLPSRQIPSSVVCVEPLSLYLHVRCSRAWVSNGLRHC
jgi:DHA1 family multidrug resistance protein-like MFS transporter